MDANEKTGPMPPAPDDPPPLPPEPAPVTGEIEVAFSEFKTSAGFLTRLPGRWFGNDGAALPDFTHAARIFPLVGAFIGVAGGLVLLVTAALGVPFWLACVLAIATTAIITGALHEDGLADTADALGGATPERRLAILDDSRVGTYGALALVFSVLIRVSALVAIGTGAPIRAALVLIAVEAVSRAAMVRLWHDLPPARPLGLSSATGAPDQNAMLVALAIAAVIAIVLCVPAIGIWPTVFAGVLVAVATFTMMRMAAHLFGGRTGDILGASQQIAAMAFLIGASAG